MATVQEVLNTAGVKAEVVESIEVDQKLTVHILSIGYANGLEIARKFLAVSEKTGYVPLFIDENAYDEYMDLIQNHTHPSDDGSTVAANLIAASVSVDVDEWMAQLEDYDFEIGDFSKKRSTWSEIPTSDKLILVPVKHSWQIPAVMYIGGWNSCPDGEIHIALHKRWHEKFGSEFISMANDAVYCLVNKPVSNREEALALAKEQAFYCPDNVVQGNGDGTTSGLAVDLMDAKAWQFWWD